MGTRADAIGATEGPPTVTLHDTVARMQRVVGRLRTAAHRSPPIEQVRWLFYLFSLAQAAGAVLLLLAATGHDPLATTVGISSTIALTSIWHLGWRRRDFPAWVSVVEAVLTAALVVASGLVEILLGILYVGLYFRASYGGLRLALAHSALIFAGLLVGQLILVAGAVGQVPTVVWIGAFGFPLVAIVMNVLATSLADFQAALDREEELRTAMAKLEAAHDRIARLEGILSTCSYCRRIRTESGAWTTLERLVEEHVDTQFSHGICDECMAREFPDLST